MGNPGIANLCQDARGGEFGQANAGNSTAGEHIFHCNCNSQRGLNEKYIKLVSIDFVLLSRSRLQYFTTEM